MEERTEDKNVLQWHQAFYAGLQIERDSYNMHHKNVLYESVMDIIVRANQEAFEEVSGMCKALEELMHDTIEKKVEERIEERTKRYERLNLLLAQSNRVADIVKAAEDKEYRQQLMEELGL